MIDLIRRSLLIGVGAASLTRDRVESFINESIQRGEMSSEQGKSLLEEVSQRAEQSQDRLETFVRYQVNRALEVAGLATRAELTRLEARVDSLETRLRDLSRSVGGAAAADYAAPGVAPITLETSPEPSPSTGATDLSEDI